MVEGVKSGGLIFRQKVPKIDLVGLAAYPPPLLKVAATVAAFRHRAFQGAAAVSLCCKERPTRLQVLQTLSRKANTVKEEGKDPKKKFFFGNSSQNHMTAMWLCVLYH